MTKIIGDAIKNMPWEENRKTAKMCFGEAREIR